jgi:hypothetical protein
MKQMLFFSVLNFLFSEGKTLFTFCGVRSFSLSVGKKLFPFSGEKLYFPRRRSFSLSVAFHFLRREALLSGEKKLFTYCEKEASLSERAKLFTFCGQEAFHFL